MNTMQINPGQTAVEQRFESIKKIPVDPDKTAVEQFGTMESWIFQLGDYRLFLNPITKTWFYFDRIHNDWKDLKYPAGSGFFYQNKDNLEFLRYGTESPGSAMIMCQKCGTSLNSGLKFCNQCGAPVPAAIHSRDLPRQLRFCPQCGAQLPEGEKFCNSCGKKLP